MQESDFGPKFQNWWKVYKFHTVAVFEYKVTKTGTFNLKNWHKKHPHQYVNLKKATTHEGVIWKISDLDPRSKPFDGFYISDSPAFLVIWFHKWQRFFIIPVHRIPDQVSISYQWCEDRFDAHGLLPEVRKEYNI